MEKTEIGNEMGTYLNEIEKLIRYQNNENKI